MKQWYNDVGDNMEKLIIGSHVSFSKNKQLYGSVLEALNYGSSTFMFYTGAPQNTVRVPINDQMTQEAMDLMKVNNMDINDVVIHAPYIINLANPVNHDFSVNFLKQEISRAEQLGISKIVLHPGSHVGLGMEEGVKSVSDSLKEALIDDKNVYICLETMAGKGSEIGSKFEELKQIIDNVASDKLMVCMDTCHMNDAGYDMNHFDKVLESFDKLIGISKIGCIHINDSKNPFLSHKDRHANIGIGTIGFDSLIKIIYNDKLKNVPKILETPYIGEDEDSKVKPYPPYKFEIEMIKNKKFNTNLYEDIKTYYR